MNIKNKLLNLRIKYTNSPLKRADLIKKKLKISMGVGCEVYDGVSFGSEPYLIDIGDNVRITNGVNFVTHDGGVWVLRNMGIAKEADLFGKIKIGNNVHIGINTVVMPGVTIGDNVIIGVGAVVTRNVASNTIVVGVPAKEIKTIEAYYEKNLSRIEYTKHMNRKEKEAYLVKKFK